MKSWARSQFLVAVAGVFVVLFRRRMLCHGQWLAAASNELQALLVNADHGLLAAKRRGIKSQQVVPPAAALLIEYPDAQHQPAPRFEFVFLTCRARSLGSHRLSQVPCGPRAQVRLGSSAAVLRAVTRAWASVSYCSGRPGRATSNTAKSMPPCKYAARVRHTAVRPIPRTPMIWDSAIPRSRQDKVWARLTSRE
jgi:hypothetical protein